MLLEIVHDGPVVVQELGAAYGGIRWVVAPDRFAAAVEMINKYGGPACWSITPV